MDTRIARELIALNNRFYRDNAQSFSQTRQAPWQGWGRVMGYAREMLPVEALRGERLLRVLDLACGNMRLASFLARELPDARIAYTGVDASEDLAGHAVGTPQGPGTLDERFIACDVLGQLLQGQPVLGTSPVAPGYDLVCCFGFLHHVPGAKLRHALMLELCKLVCPGGIVAASFWQFMHDDRLAKKAQATTAQACEHPPFHGFCADELEPGDNLLGWQDTSNSYRYCHSFEEQELDELAEAAASHGTREIARFSADGKSGALNRYLLVERIR